MYFTAEMKISTSWHFPDRVSEGGRCTTTSGYPVSAAADVCARRDFSQLEATAGKRPSCSASCNAGFLAEILNICTDVIFWINLRHFHGIQDPQWTCCHVPADSSSKITKVTFAVAQQGTGRGHSFCQNILYDKQTRPLLWFLEMAAVLVPSYHVHCGPVQFNGAHLSVAN